MQFSASVSIIFEVSISKREKKELLLKKEVLINVQLFGYTNSTFGIDLQIESHL